MDNDNKIVKYKVLIMIPCVSIQAWIKNNPNPNAPLLIDKVERACINIHAWLFNNPNPTTEEELKGLIELKGKINDNIFYYRENIISGGWEKRTMVIPTKVQEHQKFLEETQGVPADEDAIVGGN